MQLSIPKSVFPTVLLDYGDLSQGRRKQKRLWFSWGVFLSEVLQPESLPPGAILDCFTTFIPGCPRLHKMSKLLLTHKRLQPFAVLVTEKVLAMPRVLSTEEESFLYSESFLTVQ